MISTATTTKLCLNEFSSFLFFLFYILKKQKSSILRVVLCFYAFYVGTYMFGMHEIFLIIENKYFMYFM